MARYRVLEKCFLQPARTVGPRECSVGEEIEFDGVPGLSLQPLDEEARTAKLAAIGPTWKIMGLGWHQRMLKLAQSLGGGEFASIEAAQSFVEAWIAKQQAS